MDCQRKQFTCIDLKYYSFIECVNCSLAPHHQPGGGGREQVGRHHLPNGSPLLESPGDPSLFRFFEVKQRLAKIKVLTGKTLEVPSEIYGVYLKHSSPTDIHIYFIDGHVHFGLDALPIFP